jgi:hypothetical protein
MIKPEQIPDEVVEALCNHVGPVMTRADWRAAFAAGLEAWEGGYEMDGGCGSMECEERGLRLILPLPNLARCGECYGDCKGHVGAGQ